MNYTTKIKLPGGPLYAEDHPELNDYITLSMLTTKDEKKIFGSSSDNVLRDVIMNLTEPKVDINLLTGFDRLFILIELRRHTYGFNYHVKGKCSECGNISEYKVNLNDLELDELDEDASLSSTIELPKSEDSIEIRLLTHDEEKASRKRAVKLSKDLKVPANELEYVFNLEKMINKVNGETLSQGAKTEYVNNLVGMDSAFIKHSIDKKAYGYKLSLPTNCDNCGSDILVAFEFNSEFFRPRFD